MSAAGEAAPTWALYRPAQRWTFLAILFLASASSNIDRHVISVLIEPIKHEFAASDTMMGLLGGFAFAALYATLGLPVARYADVQPNSHRLMQETITLPCFDGLDVDRVISKISSFRS